MAVIALGIFIILAIRVTVGAVELRMHFVQLQTHNGVPEVFLIPAGVTVCTHGAELGDSPAGRMASPAVEFVVIWIERPSGRVVCKSRALLGIVALATLVGLVAIIADCVHLFLCLDHRRCFLNVMTVAAIFLFMTVHALEPENINMLFMLESHDRSG